jgi:hypothetical protein
MIDISANIYGIAQTAALRDRSTMPAVPAAFVYFTTADVKQAVARMRATPAPYFTKEERDRAAALHRSMQPHGHQPQQSRQTA